MIKLILTDLDGTFLDSKGSFDKEFYQQVKGSMDDQAIYFAPCTGKQCERVEELFGPELSKDLWILGDSATRIKHNNEYVYESLLPNDLGIKLINKLEEIANDYTMSEEDKQMVRGSYREVQLVEELNKITEDFVKITVYDRKKRCFEYVKELMEFKEQAYIVASEAAWIDISNAGVHKGTTVKELQKLLGVTKEETMAFGDGLNDIELLNAATYSFAMENAFEETKAAANFITRSNDEQGVLQTIQKIIALQK